MVDPGEPSEGRCIDGEESGGGRAEGFPAEHCEVRRSTFTSAGRERRRDLAWLRSEVFCICGQPWHLSSTWRAIREEERPNREPR